MAREPSFYGQRPDVEETGGTGKYKGPNRRHYIRRQNQDRREDVRFEIEKEDRRKNSGRREGDEIPKYW